MAGKDYIIHTEEDLVDIRRAAVAAATVRERIRQVVTPGMTTRQLDDLAASFIAEAGGVSAFLGYRGFPGQICISVNDQVVHGIGRPDRVLQPNDIVSTDIGVKIGRGIGDTSTTFALIDNPDENIVRLLEATEESLMAGIAKAVVGNTIRDISAAVEKVANRAKLGIVREYVGHGCGTKLHEPPEIPNFVCGWRGPKLRAGMVLAIEPMLNLGTHRVFTEQDGWTVRTLDGKPSAHFEHQILITHNKPEILTWPKK
jgi:methionyl aminopeptidase